MTLLDASLVLLCLIVIVQTQTLRLVLESARQFSERIEMKPPEVDDATPAIGKMPPALALRALGNQSIFTEQMLLGRTTMILFLTVSDTRALGYSVVSSIIHGLSSQCEERLNIVVEGGEADCLWLRDQFGLARFYGNTVHLLVAEDSTVRQHLGLKTTPSCAVFGEDGTLRKVGAPFLDSAKRTTRE